MYGEEEINAIGKLLIDQGVLNSLTDSWEDWADAGDMKVTERGAGANMSVDIAAGWAIIETVRNAKTFKVFAQNIATANVPVTANATGGNRVDAVIARISRSEEPNLLTNNILTLEVIVGSGVAALSDNDISTAIGGDDFVRLADITVPNATADIEDGDIADTRVPAKTNDGVQLAPKTLHFRTVSINPAAPAEGQFWYNDVLHTLNFFNGTSVIQLGGAAGGFDPLKASAQATPDMTVAVSAGELRFGKNEIHFAGGNSGAFTAPVSVGNKRIDLLGINDDGNLTIVRGTDTAGTPAAPAYPSDIYVVAEIYLRYGATSIKDTDDATNGYILRDARAFFVPKDMFGGDGSDGDLHVTSGTTTLDAAGAEILVKNYENLTIDASTILTISNKHANGTILHLKVRGNAVINGKIDMKGMGGSGGTAITATSTGNNGYNGTGALNPGFNIAARSTSAPNGAIYINFAHYGCGGGTGSPATSSAKYSGGGGGGGGASAGSDGESKYSTSSTTTFGWPGIGGQKAHGADGGYLTVINGRFILVACGGGGGSGGNAKNTMTSGAGGNGGGALLLEVKGNLTFGAASIVDLSGNNGGNATGSDSYGAGGGGGGGGGIGKAVYGGTLTNSGLTKTVTAGTGGTSVSSAGAGAAGGAGSFDIVKNTVFA